MKEDDCIHFPHNKNYNSSKEDKENINIITLSTDSSEDSDIEERIAEKMPPTNNTAAKLPGRQTNNSLSSLTGNIFIPPLASTTNTASTSSTSASNSCGQASVSSKKEEPVAAPRKKKVKSTEM